MKLTNILTGVLVTLVVAHSDYNAPKIVGGRKLLSEMKARHFRQSPVEVTAVQIEERNVLERQTSDGRCGPNLGRCTNCCSPEGYCGTGLDYCSAPDCQYKYGPQCDANKKPSGASTANIVRPQLGNIPYGGTGIYDCNVPGQVAFTFDDGPYLYTAALLDKLKTYNAKATFFITGNNLGKGAIDSTAQYSAVIKRMVAEGHQIASHTWSHQDLSTLDAATFNNQMVYNEMAFNNILGFFPTYMRPPYSSCDSTCASRLKTLGYHVTYFDLDTQGYLNSVPEKIQNSKNIWDQTINPANPATDNFLQIEHDIHEQVVNNLTDYVLASMYAKGFKSVTVGECLEDPKANWYRTGPGGSVPSSVSSSISATSSSSVPATSSTSTAPPSSSSPTTPGQTISTDGSCSATVTCQGSTFGSCCSQYNWCGSSVDHCGTGCNPVSGTCSGSPAVSSVRTTTTTSVAPASTKKVSTNGKCAGTTGFTCLGSSFGSCCSRAGWCGSTSAYCGTGCQSSSGTCT